MQPIAIVMAIVILGVFWGGFIYLAIKATQAK